MHNHFESNLKLLETYDSDLANRLRFHVPSGRVEVFGTPQNFASLRINQEGKTTLLHSGQDPVREAQRWLQGVNIQSPYNLMVMGCGLFYHVYQLVKHYQSSLRKLVIVEKDLDVVYTLFSAISLTDFLRTQNTFFVVDASSSEIRSFMNLHMTSFTLDGLSIVEHPSSCELYPDFYQQIRTVVQECLQGGEILLRTKVVLGGLIQDNIIRNIPYVLSQPSIAVFHGLFPQVPAFIIGAGPSLDRNMDRLAEVGDKGILIAADTIFQPLRKRGIVPHIIVTTDPTELNARHFEEIEDLGETVLVFSPSVYHRIPKKLKGTKTIIPLQTARLLSLFPQIKNEMYPFHTGVNVGQTAYNLARYMGCGPIILVGLDFSFPVEGGSTHATGTALRRDIYATDSSQKMKVELLDAERSLEEFEPIYIPGNTVEKVATNKFWFNYLRSMEQEISKTDQVVFNCTEGGARVEGAVARPLADAIAQYCVKDAQIFGNLQTVVGFFFGEPMTEGIAILEESGKILQTAIESADEGLRELSALKTIAGSVSPDRNLFQEKLDCIHQCHLNLVQNHKVYVVLDEAADSVLQDFLKRNSRPTGDLVSMENVQRAIERYQPYFEGMKKLCEHYRVLVQETLDSMQSGEFDFSSLML